uniref:Coiled-coil domain-containing protein 51 n=1 Tax=Leptobrachium leishanense TaxID=445787 RepID=A0A8C5WLQ2_9ANUR
MMRHLNTFPIVKVTMRPAHRTCFIMDHKFHVFLSRSQCSSAKLPHVNPPTEDTGASPLQRFKEAGRTAGRNFVQSVSVTAKIWWGRYEEFVGLVEIRDAQGKVAEAEKNFMVTRGIVREARESVESLQLKLKEVRDRLDRVSRDDVQYLELATLEHKLLQEEKRLRSSYASAEEHEREKFALFSASVRESHEKERTRAERTKNWSIIGSVLGAVIGVMGSTYINRVRLQELKNLLLEAQKGPISLQQAIHEHASVQESQQKDLGDLIVNLKNMMSSTSVASSNARKETSGNQPGALVTVEPVLNAVREHMAYTKESGKYLESLQQNYTNLEKLIGRLANDMHNIKSKVYMPTVEDVKTLSSPAQIVEDEDQIKNMILELTGTEQRLETHITRSSFYSTALTCTVLAVTAPILYFLLKGN